MKTNYTIDQVGINGAQNSIELVLRFNKDEGDKLHLSVMRLRNSGQTSLQFRVSSNKPLDPSLETGVLYDAMGLLRELTSAADDEECPLYDYLMRVVRSELDRTFGQEG